MSLLVSAASISSNSLQSLSCMSNGRFIRTPVPQCCTVAVMAINESGASCGLERSKFRPKARASAVRVYAETPWSPAAAANARRMRQRGLTYSIALLATGGIAGATLLGKLNLQDCLLIASLPLMTLLGHGAWMYTVHDGMVKWTGDTRGYGAFAEQDIQAGTFIGTYEGELLGLEEYYTRYPDGVSDYCITVDSEYVLDGATRALDRESFSCCHINHSATRFNVARRTLPSQQMVQMFASKDIRKDEELLLDYGRQFWSNREDMEEP